MGRKYADVASEQKFIPKISESSKRLASKQQATRNNNGIPHFMLSTKARHINLEPLKESRSPVNSVTNDTIKESELDARNAGAVIVKNIQNPSRKILPQLGSYKSSTGKKNFRKGPSSPASSSSDFDNDNQNNSADSDVVSKGMSSFTCVEFSNLPSQHLDQAVFTFHPKVSSASLKIVENLGSDFMTRQQQHIERQKKIVSF